MAVGFQGEREFIEVRSHRWVLLSGMVVLLRVAVQTASSGEDSKPWLFAAQLASGTDAANAAVEFRRIAAATDDSAARGAAYWFSAYQYWRIKQPDISEKMLDRVEDSDSGLALNVALLRGENARLVRSWDEAAFHFQSVLNSKPPPEARTYAARNLAAAEMRRGNTEAARDAVRLETRANGDSMAALDAYDRGKDRSPLIGGLLGMVPGLGYVYSGEYANAARSLLLNALFGFGMYQTGARDQWGPFAAISFFEVTWYSGSIYGGVDAAHRYNQDRRDSCDQALRGDAAFEPDWKRLPLVQLQFKF